MATPIWKVTTTEVPPDGTTVWIVRIPFFDTPIQALYDAGTQQFFYGDSDGFTTFIPAWGVFKWRDL